MKKRIGKFKQGSYFITIPKEIVEFLKTRDIYFDILEMTDSKVIIKLEVHRDEYGYDELDNRSD